MQQITANVYVETGFRGCNTSFVVTTGGVVVIDTPMVPADAKKWAAEAAKHGPVRYVINGEPHPDHVFGNCYFGGTVVAHEGTREVILSTTLDSFTQMLKGMAPDSPPPDKDFRFCPPEITLTEGLTLYLGKHTFHLMALPGHSPYQVTVYVPEERVVFTSDNVVTGTPFFFQALPDEWLKTLDRLQEMDVDKVVPGHGEVQDKSYLPQMKTNIQTWIGTVADAVEKGMTLGEAQEKLTFEKESPQLPRDERTANIIRSNVARLYEYVKNKGK
jgi:cyclase